MSQNKTQPTAVSVESFLETASDQRRQEAKTLIGMMGDISGEKPVMWGPSMIGFGALHYKYASGHEGDMPKLAFSPRKAKLTIYFEGFDNYQSELEKLGKYKTSKACLYINKLDDIDLAVLRQMLKKSFQFTSSYTGA